VTPANQITTIAAQIADQLGETTAGARAQIWRIVRTIGSQRAQAFVAQALEVEAGGGLLLPDGRRKRTLGGVFFHLVRTALSDEERQRIWPPITWKERKHQRKAQAQPAGATATVPATPLPSFQWADAAPVIAAITEHVGAARTVKVTLIGRPGQVVERQGVIVLGLRSTSTPALPKGLPAPPATPTTYMVFVSQKQWRTVAGALSNPDDALIIEGYPTADPRFAGITVYATNVTTKLLQQAKRQHQAAPERHTNST